MVSYSESMLEEKSIVELRLIARNLGMNWIDVLNKEELELVIFRNQLPQNCI